MNWSSSPVENTAFVIFHDVVHQIVIVAKTQEDYYYRFVGSSKMCITKKEGVYFDINKAFNVANNGE